MDWTLEVVMLPVADVERAKWFVAFSDPGGNEWSVQERPAGA